jgi:hypothetical protein
MAFLCPTCSGKGIVANNHAILRVSFKKHTSKSHILGFLEISGISLAIVTPNPLAQGQHQFYVGLSGLVTISIRVPQDESDYWLRILKRMPSIVEVSLKEL